MLLKMRVAVLSAYYIWIEHVLQGDTFLVVLEHLLFQPRFCRAAYADSMYFSFV